MSTNELKRAGVLARVAAGTLRLGSAATLMAVSYRQAKRLYRRYRNKGAREIAAWQRWPGVESGDVGPNPDAGVGAGAGEVRRRGRRAIWAHVGCRASGE